MRLKTFHGATVGEAMQLVKAQLGEQAVIVSTENHNGSVKITAAVEPELSQQAAANQLQSSSVADPREAVYELLIRQGLPDTFIDRLLRAIPPEVALREKADPVILLAAGLDSMFTFRPLQPAAKKPIVLVGIPGVGKSVTVAKLATREVLQRRSVFLATTDTEKTGALEQLHGFSDLLHVPLRVGYTPELMAMELQKASKNASIMVDTAGINPFVPSEMQELSDLIEAVGGEPVLVMTGGSDAIDAVDIAQAFQQELGCERLIITRVDIARRLGSLLLAAEAGGLQFSNVSITPHIVDGLSTLNPLGLARLLNMNQGTAGL